MGTAVGTPTPAPCGTALAQVAWIFPIFRPLSHMPLEIKVILPFVPLTLPSDVHCSLCHVPLAHALCQGRGPCSWFLPSWRGTLRGNHPESCRLKDLEKWRVQMGLYGPSCQSDWTPGMGLPVSAVPDVVDGHSVRSGFASISTRFAQCCAFLFKGDMPSPADL